MRQSKLQYLFGGITLASMTVLLLWVSKIPTPVSAQSVATPTAVSTATPDFSATLVAATTRTQPQATPTSDIVTNSDLVEHFEKVTSFTLNTITVVIALLGVGGVIAGYFSFKTVRDAQELIRSFEKRAREIETDIQRLKDGLEESRQVLEESRQLSMDALSRLRVFLEVRDSNYQVRTRAAQQLGASNDIAAASVLIELLENDTSLNVRAEAAYGLGQQLSKGQELGIFDKGIRTLLKGTKDKKEEVRVESVEALDFLVQKNVQLPRSVHRRMQELVEHDVNEDVVKAARKVLEHLEQ